MSASYPTKLFLAMKSGNLCAFKDCRKALTSDGVNSNPAVIGEAAHIYGESPGTKTKPASARYRSDMTDEQRNHYDNLIYLCPSCHTKIDKQEADYSAELLFSLKKEHESWVSDQLDQGMSEVSFAELEIAAKALASGKHSSNGDGFEVIPPEEKINKNGLSDTVRSDIAMGLSKSHEVERFLVLIITAIEPPRGHLMEPPRGHLMEPPHGHLMEPPHGHLMKPPRGHLMEPPRGHLIEPLHGYLLESFGRHS